MVLHFDVTAASNRRHLGQIFLFWCLVLDSHMHGACRCIKKRPRWHHESTDSTYNGAKQRWFGASQEVVCSRVWLLAVGGKLDPGFGVDLGLEDPRNRDALLSCKPERGEKPCVVAVTCAAEAALDP